MLAITPLRATLTVALSVCWLIGASYGSQNAAADPAAADTAGIVTPEVQKIEPGALRGASPLVTFAAIEQAWSRGWADSIAIYFPDGQIVLRLDKNTPESASFTKKQASYMLRDSFRYRVTESFTFLEFKYKKNEKNPPLAKAQWAFLTEPAGKAIVAKVEITLRKEGERWLISGIKIED